MPVGQMGQEAIPQGVHRTSVLVSFARALPSEYPLPFALFFLLSILRQTQESSLQISVCLEASAALLGLPLHKHNA